MKTTLLTIALLFGMLQNLLAGALGGPRVSTNSNVQKDGTITELPPYVPIYDQVECSSQFEFINWGAIYEIKQPYNYNDPIKGHAYGYTNLGKFDLTDVSYEDQTGNFISVPFVSDPISPEKYLIDHTSVTKDQFGRFTLIFTFSSSQNKHDSNGNLLKIKNTLRLQVVCPEHRIVWNGVRVLNINEIVDSYIILNDRKETLLEKSNELTISTEGWIPGTYYVEVLAPKELAGLYTFEIGSEAEIVLVYPNPVTDFLYLKGEISKAVLKDEYGTSLEEFDAPDKIDMREYKAGVYYLWMFQPFTDEVRKQRILVER